MDYALITVGKLLRALIANGYLTYPSGPFSIEAGELKLTEKATKEYRKYLGGGPFVKQEQLRIEF